MRKDYDRFYSDNYSQKDPIRVDSQEKIIEEEKDQEPEDKKLNKDFVVIDGTVIELKGVNPPYRLVKVLADYFGVSIEYMMNE